MNSSVKVADPLPALDLPPASSPKFKTIIVVRTHIQGCPPDLRQTVNPLVKNSIIPSFKRIIEDGIITDVEIEEQSQRVVTKIKEIEAIATPEVKEKMRELLAEMSVLVSISNLKDLTTSEENVYHYCKC